MIEELLSLRQQIELPPSVLFAGTSKALTRLKQEIVSAAPTDTPVLIQGACGLGKRTVAEAIHALSRRDGPMIAVDCAALSAERIETELFGQDGGADPTATRIGLIEKAQGGTLFLDEIGALPIQVQVRLICALRNGTFQRVGGHMPIAADFRLISATQHDLAKAVAQGRFRENLLYRINLVNLKVPALREHASDIPAILAAMAREDGHAQPLHLSQEAADALQAYTWPGDLQELRTFHSRAQTLFGSRVTMGQDEVCAAFAPTPRPILALHPVLPAVEPEPVDALPVDTPDLRQLLSESGSIDLRAMLQRLEKRVIRSALDLSEGRVSPAADMLQLKRTTLIGRMQKLGLGVQGAH